MLVLRFHPTHHHQHQQSSHRSAMMMPCSLYLLYQCTVMLMGCVLPVSSVTHPPSIIRQEEKHEVVYDTRMNVVLECEAIGDPKPEYEWIKNGRWLDESATGGRIARPQAGKGTIIIHTPLPDDQGLYQCKASNSYGTALSNAVYLRTAVLEQFPDKPGDYPVVEVNNGDSLTMECSPPKGVPDSQVFWTIYTPDGFRSLPNTHRISQDFEDDLHFVYVNASQDQQQQGHPYTCNAYNPVLNTLESGFFQVLKVRNPGDQVPRRGPHKLYSSERNIVAYRMKELQLKCIYGGYPIPRITWTRFGGRELPAGRHTFKSNDQTLVIASVLEEDAGDYECEAESVAGATQTSVITVSVQAAPYWIKKPVDTNATEGEDHEFECEAGGDPLPRIEWYINGVRLAQAQRTGRPQRDGNKIILRDLKKEADTAVYQCNASSTLGYVYTNAYLNVLAEPPVFLAGCDRVRIEHIIFCGVVQIAAYFIYKSAI